MIKPKRQWSVFKSENHKLEKFKQWGLISQKAKEIKKLYYKGAYTKYPVECDIVGYVDDNEIIISINEQLHSIHPDYLLDMQKKERFIIVDIETPMSFSVKDGIREVAMIAVEDYRIVDSLHLAIIKDKEEYKKGFGAGLEAIENNTEMIKKFKTFLKKYKCPLIAHNASFDRKFLRYWHWLDDKQIFYCSRDNIKSIKKLNSYKLVDLLNYYGIKQEQEHKAMEDVLDLLEVLKKVKIEKWTKLGDYIEDCDEKSNLIKRNNKKSYINDKKQRDVDKKKIEEAQNNIIDNIFDGKKIVFTGDMKKDRTEMRVTAIKHGAVTANSISRKTDLLVVGENPGSKLKKANELGVKTIYEEEFWNIVHNKKRKLTFIGINLIRYLGVSYN